MLVSDIIAQTHSHGIVRCSYRNGISCLILALKDKLFVISVTPNVSTLQEMYNSKTSDYFSFVNPALISIFRSTLSVDFAGFLVEF